MIYKEWSCKNFSSYRSAKFNLETDDERNVVVIYGLNGHGKSTIINGLKLALQGSDAGLVEDETYDQYLFEHINQQALQEGKRDASVSVVLLDGNKEIEVRRSWVLGYHNVPNEEVRIFENGEERRDFQNEESKREYLRNLISKEVLQFFAFDAELIPYMQDDSDKSKRLGQDIAQTLGIRSYETTELLLKKCLDSLKRKMKPARKSQITIITGEIEFLDEGIEEVEQSRREFLEKYQETEERIRENREWLSKYGTDGEKSKAQLEEKLTSLREEKERIETSVIRYANDLLPYVMMHQELSELRDQLNREEKWTERNEGTEKQEELLQKFLSVLEEELTPPLIRSQMEKLKLRVHKVFDELTVNHKEGHEYYHLPALSEIDKERLLEDMNEKWDNVLQENAIYQRDFQDYERILSEMDATAKQIKMLPNAERTGSVQEETRVLEEEEQQLRETLSKLEEKHRDFLSQKEAKFQELKKAKLEIVQNKRIEEKIALVEGSRSVLKEFVKKLKVQKAEEVRDFSSSIFQSVSHKDRLLEHFEIDNETFDLTMYNRYGQKHPKRLMSKGERQLLSLALTYAIAKSGSEGFGFIIDTPFARIDGVHRKQFLQKFVPELGQVIFLSHDREIEERDREMIANQIAREYTIYVDDNGVTQIVPYYIWGSKPTEVS